MQDKDPHTNSRSIDEAFHQGNYHHVARLAEDTDWRKHAARGLIGRAAEAIERLQSFSHEEAQFFLGARSHTSGKSGTNAS